MTNKKTTLYNSAGQEIVLKRIKNDNSNEYQMMDMYLNPGVIENDSTGAGTGIDRVSFSNFARFVPRQRDWLQNIYLQSWAAKKFIDIPSNDSVIKWRSYYGIEPKMIDAFVINERKHQVKKKLSKALKAARLYGTSYIVIVTKNSPLEEELNPDSIRKNDLVNLLIFDGYQLDISEDQIEKNPLEENYMQPNEFVFNFQSNRIIVHPSRVLTFRGIEPLTEDGFGALMDTGDGHGMSELVPVIITIIQDAQMSQGISHLMSESDIGIMKLDRFRETVNNPNDLDDDDITPQEMAKQISINRSIYRMIFMDTKDEFNRESVNFSGLANILDYFALRLAAAADIPATRFWGRSPAGQNSTGLSDELNYAKSILEIQETKLEKPLSVLDQVIAKDIGLNEVPHYNFTSLVSLSEKEQAETFKIRIEGIEKLLNSQIIDETQAENMLELD